MIKLSNEDISFQQHEYRRLHDLVNKLTDAKSIKQQEYSKSQKVLTASLNRLESAKEECIEVIANYEDALSEYHEMLSNYNNLSEEYQKALSELQEAEVRLSLCRRELHRLHLLACMQDLD